MKNALLIYDSDFTDFIGINAADSKGYYCITAPKKSDVGPFSYTTKVTIVDPNVKTKEQKTLLLDEFEYYTMNITFNPKSRWINLSIFDLLARLLIGYPLMKLIFGR